MGSITINEDDRKFLNFTTNIKSKEWLKKKKKEKEIREDKSTSLYSVPRIQTEWCVLSCKQFLVSDQLCIFPFYPWIVEL